MRQRYLCASYGNPTWNGTDGPRVTTVSTYEVTNALQKNIKDNNIEAVKLEHCDKELQ